MNRLIFWPPAMQKGQYDRFITHGFIHADGMHLLFNMFTLFFFEALLKVSTVSMPMTWALYFLFRWALFLRFYPVI